MIHLTSSPSCPQSYLTLCNPMNYTVHGILQDRILEWVAISFSRGSSQPRNQTQVSCICRQILYQLSHQGSPRILEWVAYPFSRDLPIPGIELGSPALQADSLPTELSEKPKGHLVCFPISAVMNEAAINIHVQVLYRDISFQILGGKYQGVQLLDYTLKVCLAFSV